MSLVELPIAPAPPSAWRLLPRLIGDGAALTRELLVGSAAPNIGPLVAIAASGSAIFGFAVGLQSGLVRASAAAVKMPLILMVAAALALPILHVGCSLAGTRIHPERLAAILAQALATAATVMAGLAPLVVLVWLTLLASPLTPLDELGNPSLYYVYRRVLLSAAAVAATGGFAGATTLVRALPLRGTVPYVIGLGLAGLQVGWLLRPLVGVPGDGWLLRPPESNGLYALLYALWRVLS